MALIVDPIRPLKYFSNLILSEVNLTNLKFKQIQSESDWLQIGFAHLYFARFQYPYCAYFGRFALVYFAYVMVLEFAYFESLGYRYFMKIYNIVCY